MTIWLTMVFWLAVALLFYTHVGYPVTLWILEALGVGNRAGQLRGDRVGAFPSLTADEPDTDENLLPMVSLIIAAYNEEDVIEAKVENALELVLPA